MGTGKNHLYKPADEFLFIIVTIYSISERSAVFLYSMLLLTYSRLMSSGRSVKPRHICPITTSFNAKRQGWQTPGQRSGTGLEPERAARPQLLCFLIKMTAALSLFLPDSSLSPRLTDSA